MAIRIRGQRDFVPVGAEITLSPYPGVQNNAGYNGVYAARVDGSKGDLYVRVGGSDNDWQPSLSGYGDHREYAQGAGCKVWVGLPGNPEVRQAPRHEPFDVPAYRPAAEITVPDDWLD